MKMVERPNNTKLNESAFAWNRLGWFVGSLGGNAALFVGGIQFPPHSVLVGLTWLLTYFLVVIATFVLWRLRWAISAYHGVQIGIGIFGLCWLISFSVAVFVRPDLIPVVSSDPNTPFQRWLMNNIMKNPAVALVPLLIFPLSMCWLHRMHRRQIFDMKSSNANPRDNDRTENKP